MTKYAISYDLNKADKNYDGLISKIKTYPYINTMKSMWFIKTNDSAATISSKLMTEMDTNDSLFVSEVTSNRQGWLKQDVWDFLKS